MVAGEASRPSSSNQCGTLLLEGRFADVTETLMGSICIAQVPYFWFGSKLYDLFAGSHRLESSYFLSKGLSLSRCSGSRVGNPHSENSCAGKALEKFPMLRAHSLVGAMVYYDGAHNDSRTNIALALTAASYGATVANHVEVTALDGWRR